MQRNLMAALRVNAYKAHETNQTIGLSFPINTHLFLIQRPWTWPEKYFGWKKDNHKKFIFAINVECKLHSTRVKVKLKFSHFPIGSKDPRDVTAHNTHVPNARLPWELACSTTYMHGGLLKSITVNSKNLWSLWERNAMNFDTFGAWEARKNFAVLSDVRKVIDFQEFKKKAKTTTADIERRVVCTTCSTHSKRRFSQMFIHK